MRVQARYLVPSLIILGALIGVGADRAYIRATNENELKNRIIISLPTDWQYSQPRSLELQPSPTQPGLSELYRMPVFPGPSSRDSDVESGVMWDAPMQQLQRCNFTHCLLKGEI